MLVPKKLSFENLSSFRDRIKNQKIIFVSGCFDVLHTGHLDFLYSAKKEADILIVGVLDDKFVKERKGLKRPVFKEEERIKMISSLEIVDFVVLFSQKKAENIIKNLRPDFYGIGGNRDKNKIVERKILEESGVSIKFLPDFKSRSTSEILKIIDLA